MHSLQDFMLCSDNLDWYLVAPISRKTEAVNICGHLGGELPVEKSTSFSKNTT